MFSSIKRGARIAAVAGLTAAVVVGLAGPASAAPVPGNNSATGIEVTGLANAGPFSMAAFPNGPTTDTLAGVDVIGLVSSGTLVTNAGPTSADASVQNLSVTLAPLTTLKATAVSSQCSRDPNTGRLTGSSSIAGGVIDLPLLANDITLATSPAANTTVTALDPSIATVILNRQTTNADGSLTVDAIFIQLLNGQTVTIASSTCQPTVLVIPVIAPAFAIGAGVLGLLGFGFFLYRRQSSAPAAA